MRAYDGEVATVEGCEILLPEPLAEALAATLVTAGRRLARAAGELVSTVDVS